MSNISNSKIQYGQYNVSDADICVCLNVGQPSNSQLPLNEYSTAMINVLKRGDPSILQYGKIQGYDVFRNILAEFLSKHYQKYFEKSIEYEKMTTINVNPNNLIITNGNTGGLQLLLSLFAEKDMTIFVEDPTYFLAFDSFKDLGLNVKPIKMESDGICVDQLKLFLEKEDHLKRCILYTIPFHHNPTGFTLSSQKKKQLVQLTNEFPNLLIISDEVYHMLSFDFDDGCNVDSQNTTNTPLPLCYYHDNFISLGSFSKIFCPAIRLGWIHTKNNAIYNKIIGCGQLDSSGNVNPLGCATMHELIVSGDLDNTINKWKKFLAYNCKNMFSLVITMLANEIENIVCPSGGYFLWIKFKPHIDTVKLSKLMESYGVKFHHGNKFSPSGNANQFMRLSFSWYQVSSDYVTGISRLKTLINENCTPTSSCNTIISISVDEHQNNQNIQVFVLGHRGKLGSLIVQELEKAQDLTYGGHIDHSINLNNLTQQSVIIDVSSAQGTSDLLTTLIHEKIYCPVVIGTTGQLPSDLILLYGQYAPVVITTNFSKGLVQMKKIIDVINKSMWKPSITELHHSEKKDTPSGTAKTLAIYYGTELIPFDSIISIREGTTIGEHHLLLDGTAEYITISHVAKTRKLFAEGSLEWIKWIVKQPKGVYTSM